MIDETAKARRFYIDERNAARLYAYLAQAEMHPVHMERFPVLSRVQTAH